MIPPSKLAGGGIGAGDPGRLRYDPLAGLPSAGAVGASCARAPRPRRMRKRQEPLVVLEASPLCTLPE